MPLKINVPYHQKESAKNKGAFWDEVEKTWYIPNHKNVNDFSEWIETEKFSIIAKVPFYIAVSHRICWKCKRSTKVVALAANGFLSYDQVLMDDTNPDDENFQLTWVYQNYFTFFVYPIYIN